MDLEKAVAADFEPHVGADFRLGIDDDRLSLRLTAVERQTLQPHAPRPEPFSLVFAGPREPRLVQGTYGLAHEALGKLEVFLVPIAYAADGGLLYEAVFN